MSNVFQAGRNFKKSPGLVHIYGVSWDGTSTTALTRTDEAANFTDPVPYVSGAASYSSPFDDIMPWKGMIKVEDSEAGTLVEIPKFWYKLTQNGFGVNIQIANAAVEGFSVSPAHMDRGDGKGERDVVYIGRYHCSSSNYKSITSQRPIYNVQRSATRSYIHNLGSKIWQMDFALWFTICLLYIVEYADWNSQAKIGAGSGDGSLQNTGLSDSIPYHTGTPYNSRDTYGAGVQYRWIESLWDNIPQWLDGNYFYQGYMYLILNPSNFSDNSNGVICGTASDGSYYPTELDVNVSYTNALFPLFFPYAKGGSSTTYIPDQVFFPSSSNVSYYWPYTGGCQEGWYWGKAAFGLFFFQNTNSTQEDQNIPSCRLMKLP